MLVTGDWNDVEASVLAALSDNEVAILHEELGDTKQKFELLRVTDDAGWIVAMRESTADTDRIRIRLTAKIGYFGDPPRERKLLDSVARRLRQLAGVEYRPISR